MDQRPKLELILVPEWALREAYNKTMPYQLNEHREGQVICFGGHRANGVYEIVNVVDITPADSTAAGITTVPPGPLIQRHREKGMRIAAIFHSHPHNNAYVSQRDKATAEKYENESLYGSITPEGIFTFFGFSYYQILGCAPSGNGFCPSLGFTRKLNDNQYQIDIDKPRAPPKAKRARVITFEPYKRKKEGN